ncbi:MAG: DUF5618 family protein [Bacteroidales bacterium]|jgi:hypothetical protein|nr:DUF5618 family protein [Bacteroidales bacterium]MDY0314658.1 DUF5618 family protein [Bacteroidales bacterium]NLB85622.1 DUF5618 family protein [Bacteroidales bacterium]
MATTSVKNDPIEEAKRYVANAKKLLKDNGKLDSPTSTYQDSKYVKMAGNTLWNGCLIALDAAFPNVKKEKGRPSIQKYLEAVSIRDKKLKNYVLNAYNITHLYMGYDGTGSKHVVDGGLKNTILLIDRCAILYGKK